MGSDRWLPLLLAASLWLPACSTAPLLPPPEDGQPDSTKVEEGPRRTEQGYQMLMLELPPKQPTSDRMPGSDPMPGQQAEKATGQESPQHSLMKSSDTEK